MPGIIKRSRCTDRSSLPRLQAPSRRCWPARWAAGAARCWRRRCWRRRSARPPGRRTSMRCRTHTTTPSVFSFSTSTSTAQVGGCGLQWWEAGVRQAEEHCAHRLHRRPALPLLVLSLSHRCAATAAAAADGAIVDSKLSVVGLDSFSLAPALPPSFASLPPAAFANSDWEVRGGGGGGAGLGPGTTPHHG